MQLYDRCARESLSRKQDKIINTYSIDEIKQELEERNFTEEPACNFCGSRGTSVKVVLADGCTIVECVKCKLCFTSPRLDEKKWEFYIRAEDSRRNRKMTSEAWCGTREEYRQAGLRQAKPSQAKQAHLWRQNDGHCLPLARTYVEELHDNTEKMLKILGRKFSNIETHSFIESMCDKDGCPIYLEGEFIYRDADHLRRNFSDTMVNSVLDATVLRYATDWASLGESMEN